MTILLSRGFSYDFVVLDTIPIHVMRLLQFVFAAYAQFIEMKGSAGERKIGISMGCG